VDELKIEDGRLKMKDERLKMEVTFAVLTFSIFYFLFSIPSVATAAFLDPGWNVRATAMGGAFTALSDDGSGIFANPAGCARAKKIEAAFMYVQPYKGLELYCGEDKTNLGMHCYSFLYPFKNWGTAGFGLTNLSASAVYGENVYIASYAIPAIKIKELFEKMKPKDEFFGSAGWETGRSRYKTTTYLGINLKFMNHKYLLDKYAKTDPVFENGSSESAVGMDFGILVLYRELSFGLAVKDFNQPNVGLKSKDIVPREVKFGTSLRVGKFRPSFDVSRRDKLSNIHLGGEYSLKSLFLRAGVNLDEAAAGFGFRKNWLALDYSFVFPLHIKDSLGSHRISIKIIRDKVTQIDSEAKPLSAKELKKKEEAELERKRTGEIKNLLRDARRHVRSKEYEKATQTITEVFNIDPKNKPAKSLLKEIDNRKKADIRTQEQRETREKETEIRVLKRKIQQKLDRQLYDEAIKLAEEALKIAPEDKSVKKLLKQAKKKITDDK